eukprot:Opistho-2@27122
MGVLQGAQLFVLIVVPSLLVSWIAAVVLEESRGINRLHPNNVDAHADTVIIDGKDEKLFWFVQVSDIHLSKFREPERGTDLRRFIERTLPVVDPAFVIVTGDLTDAKDEALVDSIQFEDEWRSYEIILRETGIIGRTPSMRHGEMRVGGIASDDSAMGGARVEGMGSAAASTYWMDIRGNHDAFDVPAHHGDHDFFARLSASRQHGYHFTFDTSYGSYRFVAMDATPAPGPRRPFNFFGVATASEVDRLDAAVGPFGAHNHTIVFGHYPLSTVVSARGSSGLTAAQVVSRTTAYVCGHLHTLLGIAPTLYVTHLAGFMELELGDWKENRRYRVIAVDHDLVSFVDAAHGDWPVILLTNPKDSRFAIPRREPTNRIARSTHVRALVFSPHPIVSVTATVDGKLLDGPFERSCGAASGGECALFVHTWDPSSLAAGKHVMRVEAVDAAGNRKVLKQPFSVDGSRPWRFGMGEIILLPDYGLLLKCGFCLVYAAVVGGLLVVPWVARRRLVARQALARWSESQMALIVDLPQSPPSVRGGESASIAGTVLPVDTDVGLVAWAVRSCKTLAAATAFRFVELAGVPSVHRPLLAYSLYLLVGPWFIGELVRGDPFGCFFATGVWVQGTFIPVAETFNFAAQHIVFALAPVALHLSSRVGTATFVSTHGASAAGEFRHRGSWSRRAYGISVILFVLFHINACLDVWRWYGFLAFAVSPGKTWFLPLVYYLTAQAEAHYEAKRRGTAPHARPPRG